MSKRKQKKEDLTSTLGMIDLSKFAKEKPKKREPICKDCKDKDCDNCVRYDWEDLGYHVEKIVDYFTERLSHSIAGAVASELKYLWGDKEELEKLMNKFGMDFIREMEMRIKAEE